jgi:hypothetical protein
LFEAVDVNLGEAGPDFVEQFRGHVVAGVVDDDNFAALIRQVAERVKDPLDLIDDAVFGVANRQDDRDVGHKNLGFWATVWRRG